LQPSAAPEGGLIKLSEAARQLACHIETLRLRVRRGELAVQRGAHGAYYLTSAALAEIVPPRPLRSRVFEPESLEWSWQLLAQQLPPKGRGRQEALGLIARHPASARGHRVSTPPPAALLALLRGTSRTSGASLQEGLARGRRDDSISSPGRLEQGADRSHSAGRDRCRRAERAPLARLAREPEVSIAHPPRPATVPVASGPLQHAAPRACAAEPRWREASPGVDPRAVIPVSWSNVDSCERFRVGHVSPS